MSNYIEYNDTIAFHPGYYIKEIIDESGLTQEDFAKRLDTTPKNISLLVRGEQNLSIDIAMKLSRMIGTSVSYWLNLQNAYDSLVAEHRLEDELVEERIVFESLDYKYFETEYGLPHLPRKIDEQINRVREYFNVASLRVLTKRDMSVKFRSSTDNLSVKSIIKANAMVQIATNMALKVDAPRYNKSKFEDAVSYALTLTEKHDEFYPMIYKAFMDAGVIFVILPNLPGSNINGATKKVGDNIMLMVNDRRLYADSFWFTLMHEIGHILNGDFGISFDQETGEQELLADKFAEDNLIPKEEYTCFIEQKDFNLNTIRKFAKQIDRDPGIVLGRLQNDGFVDDNDAALKSLRKKYRVKMCLQ